MYRKKDFSRSGGVKDGQNVFEYVPSNTLNLIHPSGHGGEALAGVTINYAAGRIRALLTKLMLKKALKLPIDQRDTEI